MNITELFEMQRVLDERIIKEHGLEGEDLLQERILALNVELAELAQETRCFKFWSKNQQPSDRVLDELVDVLHFVLSIGIHTDNEVYFNNQTKGYNSDLVSLFNLMFRSIGVFASTPSEENYFVVTRFFRLITAKLGFTWEQVTEAYKAKNAENHSRQDRGY